MTVTVHDAGHGPVGSAAVTGAWSGAFSGTSSCTTGADGRCSVSTGTMRSGTSVTFTVTGVSHATLTYDASANEVTSITVTR